MSHGAADGCCQVGLKSVGIETIRAIGDFPSAINHHDGWESVDGEEAVEAVGKYDRGARLVILQIARNQSFIFVAIGGQKQHIGIRLEIGGDASEQRFERMARATPGGPEIDNEDFPLRAVEREGRAFRSFPEREIRRLASVGVFLGFGVEGSVRNFIESEQQILAQPSIRAAGKPPDVA